MPDRGFCVTPLQEVLRLYRDAVNALPSRQREVYLLSREKGLSHREIAEQLGISPHTIKRHLSEAMHSLRSRFPAETLALLLILTRCR